MNDGMKFDQERLARLLEAMSEEERQQLQLRAKAGVEPLTLDDVGMLFLMTREQIRALEKKANG